MLVTLIVCMQFLLSDQVLLYAGSSDVRIVYTPALYWQPTDIGYMYTTHRVRTSHTTHCIASQHTQHTPFSSPPQPSILACGHCAEVNFRTDLNLMLGPEQVQTAHALLNLCMYTGVCLILTPYTRTPHMSSYFYPNLIIWVSKLHHASP